MRYTDDDISQALKQLLEPPSNLPERVMDTCHKAAVEFDDADADFLRPTASCNAAPDHSRWRWTAWLSSTAAAAAVAAVCAAVTASHLGQSRQLKQSIGTSTSIAAMEDCAAPLAENVEEVAVSPMPMAIEQKALVRIAQAPMSDKVSARHSLAYSTDSAGAAAISLGDDASTPSQGFSLQDSRRLHTAFGGDATAKAAKASSLVSSLRRRTAANGRPQPLSEDISQVWLTDSEPPSAADLDVLSKRLGKASFTIEHADEDCTLIHVTATDQMVQELVDTLHDERGFTLLSPSLPQPGEADAVVFKGGEVKYTIKLIRR